MAITLIGIRESADAGHITTFFISGEYIPHKERDEFGNVLPDQEWQHPEPAGLHYCRLGTFAMDEGVGHLLDALLNLGATQMGGHVRVKVVEDASWMPRQIETWADRAEREETERIERERQYQFEHAQVYGYCSRCAEHTEQCKNPQHRGPNLCINCNGGAGNTTDRHCSNCLDLPWRNKRERALGQEIVYTSEM